MDRLSLVVAAEADEAALVATLRAAGHCASSSWATGPAAARGHRAAVEASRAWPVKGTPEAAFLRAFYGA